MQRILFNFFLAIEAVLTNKLRAILTALGIIFGVAAVIAMLAIGTGAKQSILAQMKLIGTNNIVVKAVLTSAEEDQLGGGGANKNPWTPGLTLEDVKSIQKILPTIEAFSPEIVLNNPIIQSGKLQRAKCIGITNNFFELNNLKIGLGNQFHDKHLSLGKPVCIIGKSIQTKFFSQENPVGKKIKCGNTWLTIVGVLEKRIATKESLENLGIRDYNDDVYIPITTALRRFKDRAFVSLSDLSDGDDDEDDAQNSTAAKENYHQLDRLVLRVKESNTLQASVDVIGRLLRRRHHGVIDYEIKVPELLLQQQQKTQDTFNFVLAVIAGISLLVGGIGIMNIMLASVLERIKEIGLRRSLGATQTDIILQFLFEAVFISLIGGVIGVILGISAAEAIASSADIPTVVSTWSILLSFGVAASVGIVFGLFPARKAALHDPIKALRSD